MRRFDTILEACLVEYKVGNWYHIKPSDHTLDEFPELDRYLPNIVAQLSSDRNDGRYWFEIGGNSFYVTRKEIGERAKYQRDTGLVKILAACTKPGGASWADLMRATRLAGLSSNDMGAYGRIAALGDDTFPMAVRHIANQLEAERLIKLGYKVEPFNDATHPFGSGGYFLAYLPHNYPRRGYITRRKEPGKRYRYFLSDKGKKLLYGTSE